MADGQSGSFCAYCGTVDSKRLGLCNVCRRAVCEKCGNIQHCGGEREVVHNECLKESGDSFSMIKFVKD